MYQARAFWSEGWSLSWVRTSVPGCPPFVSNTRCLFHAFNLVCSPEKVISLSFWGVRLAAIPGGALLCCSWISSHPRMLSVIKPSQVPFLAPSDAPDLTGVAKSSSSRGLSGSCPLHPSSACSAQALCLHTQPWPRAYTQSCLQIPSPSSSSARGTFGPWSLKGFPRPLCLSPVLLNLFSLSRCFLQVLLLPLSDVWDIQRSKVYPQFFWPWVSAP